MLCKDNIQQQSTRLVFKLRYVFLALLLLSLFSLTSALADEVAAGTPLVVPPQEMPAWLATQSVAVPVFDLARSGDLQPFAELPAASLAAGDQIAALLAWNEAGRLPLKNGFSRPLPLPQQVTVNHSRLSTPTASFVSFAGGLFQTDGDAFAWAAEVRVDNGFRLRLHLSDVDLPADARLWITGSNDERTGPFGLEMLVDGNLWTPSAAGPSVRLEVEATSPGSFVVDRVLELLPLSKVSPSAAPSSVLPTWLDGHVDESSSVSAPVEVSCRTDASCVNLNVSGADLRKAYAQLHYVVNGESRVCSGGLLNDTKDDSFIPYLLTANHCFSTQSGAASLEAYWDYMTDSCNGNSSSVFAHPRSTGSTLLATSKQSDFTLVRLNGVPGERLFLGWDARTTSVGPGTKLYRISHPAPNGILFPQSFSETTVSAAPGSCGGTSDGRPLDDLTKFIRSDKDVGGTFGGSSGAPVMIGTGQVVGQLFGQCGLLPKEGCFLGNQVVDGAFSATFPFIEQYLAPSEGPGSTEPCVEDSTTACLLDDRFRATVRYRTSFDNLPANASALRKPVTGFANPSFETVFFFFNSPDNIEMMLKMLDQGNKNSSGQPTIAVLFGSATPLRTELTIEDTETGARKTYTSGFNTMMGRTDFTAFVK